MTVIEDIRKTVSQYPPVLAVVGVTDLAVARVRKAAEQVPTYQAEVESRVTKAQEEVEKVFASLDPATVQAFVAKNLDRKHLQAQAQQVPALAVARVLEVAGKVEGVYEGLATRGRQLVDRVEAQPATQDLLAQGKSTLTRTRAAVTTARKAVDETASAAMGVVSAGRKGAVEVVEDVVQGIEKAVTGTEKTVAETVAETEEATKAAFEATTQTARKRAVSTRGAAKAVATSARKTAGKAVKAAEAAAEQVGD